MAAEPTHPQAVESTKTCTKADSTPGEIQVPVKRTGSKSRPVGGDQSKAIGCSIFGRLSGWKNPRLHGDRKC